MKLIPAAIVFANRIPKPFHAAYRNDRVALGQVWPGLLCVHPVRVEE
jgi:hypothetical protein